MVCQICNRETNSNHEMDKRKFANIHILKTKNQFQTFNDKLIVNHKDF